MAQPKIRQIQATEVATGQRTQLTEVVSQINAGGLLTGDSWIDGLSSFRGPDGETLSPDGDDLMGIHSGKRYRRT